MTADKRRLARRSTAGATRVADASFRHAWLFPVVLAAVVVGAVGLIWDIIDLPSAADSAEVSARLTWAIAAMLFTVLFAFTVGACNTLMFRCGTPKDAFRAMVLTSVLGLAAVVAFTWNADIYLGPRFMRDLLGASAFCFPGVKELTAAFDGFAVWAAILVVTTSCVIVRRRVKRTELSHLSRQLRGARTLMHTSAALLITGVAATGALHKWPAEQTTVGCDVRVPTSVDKRAIEATALAISSTVGTIFSVVLAAAYLPLGIVLRQRAYRVIRPWEKTEAWLAMHGLSLLPAQQLAKVLLILSPLLAGGPLVYLVNLLGHR